MSNKSLDKFWDYVDGEKPDYDQASKMLGKNVDESGVEATAAADTLIQKATRKSSKRVYEEHRGPLKRLSKKIAKADAEMKEEIASGEPKAS
jgi:hypothetical protein